MTLFSLSLPPASLPPKSREADALDLFATVAEASAELRATASTIFAAHTFHERVTKVALETVRASARHLVSACDDYEDHH